MEHEVISNSPFAPPELDEIPLPMSLKKIDRSTKAGSPGSSQSEASLGLAYFPCMQSESVTRDEMKFATGSVTSTACLSATPSHFSESEYLEFETFSL